MEQILYIKIDKYDFTLLYIRKYTIQRFLLHYFLLYYRLYYLFLELNFSEQRIRIKIHTPSTVP